MKHPTACKGVFADVKVRQSWQKEVMNGMADTPGFVTPKRDGHLSTTAVADSL